MPTMSRRLERERHGRISQLRPIAPAIDAFVQRFVVPKADPKAFNDRRTIGEKSCPPQMGVSEAFPPLVRCPQR